jgi:hypothetical protein
MRFWDAFYIKAAAKSSRAEAAVAVSVILDHLL